MKSQHGRRKRKFHIGKGRRLQIYAWCLVLTVMTLLGSGGTYAWYTLKEREAETKTAVVTKPYHLSLDASGESDGVQLSIGSLLQGKTKQIVFCVSSEEAQKVNQDTVTFNYALELIHTDNLALKYEIYPLENLTPDAAGNGNAQNVITTEHEVTDADGNTTTAVLYWQKASATALAGVDVSEERWKQAGLMGDGETSALAADIINHGTYISYSSTDVDGEGSADLKLMLGPDTYTTQYFVMEISWNITSGFEKYDRETDMIYLLAKAVEPKPE